MERILEYYQPAKDWIIEQVKLNSDRIPLLGISAPQGTGKSTFARFLVDTLKKNENLNVLEISIDDFYLTRADQLSLARKTAHPFLQERGYPGTHDLELMYKTLESLLSGQIVSIPRYNKSAHQGKGDRYPKEQWTNINTPPDLIVLEGWMLGYAPISSPPAQMEAINGLLNGYIKLNEMFDFFIHIHAREVEFVLEWRSQAERERREKGMGAMSEKEIKSYLELFIPCYRTYNPVLLQKKSISAPILRFELDIERNLVDTIKL